MENLTKKLSPGLVATAIAAALTMGFLGHAEACPTSDPFIGTVCAFALSSCPQGWTPAEGQSLSIAQNTALFSLLGFSYGGDGQTTFSLPDLRARTMRGAGAGPGLSPVVLGQSAGEDTLTVTVNQMPAHSHALRATNVVADAPGPNAKLLARVSPDNGSIKPYNGAQAGAPTVALAPASIGPTGGGQPVDVRSPYLAFRMCIATQGVYPARPDSSAPRAEGSR